VSNPASTEVRSWEAITKTLYHSGSVLVKTAVPSVTGEDDDPYPAGCAEEVVPAVVHSHHQGEKLAFIKLPRLYAVELALAVTDVSSVIPEGNPHELVPAAQAASIFLVIAACRSMILALVLSLHAPAEMSMSWAASVPLFEMVSP